MYQIHMLYKKYDVTSTLRMGSLDSVWLLTSKNTLETIQNTLATAQMH